MKEVVIGYDGQQVVVVVVVVVVFDSHNLTIGCIKIIWFW